MNDRVIDQTGTPHGSGAFQNTSVGISCAPYLLTVHAYTLCPVSVHIHSAPYLYKRIETVLACVLQVQVDKDRENDMLRHLQRVVS